jgi:hypothetical protein
MANTPIIEHMTVEEINQEIDKLQRNIQNLREDFGNEALDIVEKFKVRVELYQKELRVRIPGAPLFDLLNKSFKN